MEEPPVAELLVVELARLAMLERAKVQGWTAHLAHHHHRRHRGVEGPNREGLRQDLLLQDPHLFSVYTPTRLNHVPMHNVVYCIVAHLFRIVEEI